MKKDITSKTKSLKHQKRNPIADKDLKKAFQHSVIEGRKWGSAAQTLEKENRFDTQACICYLFSIEIVMKGLLMNNGINITNNKHTHSLFELFRYLDEDAKSRIMNEVKFNDKPIFNLLDDYIVFNSFEEELEFISNDFIGLRYNFERFLNGQGIYVMTDFVKSLALSTIRIANERLKEIPDNEL